MGQGLGTLHIVVQDTDQDTISNVMADTQLLFLLEAGKKVSGTVFLPYADRTRGIKCQIVCDNTPAYYLVSATAANNVFDAPAPFTDPQAAPTLKCVNVQFVIWANLATMVRFQFRQGTQDPNNPTTVLKGAFLRLFYL
jgi:hypothetical protein